MVDASPSITLHLVQLSNVQAGCEVEMEKKPAGYRPNVLPQITLP
jgi:hypothetical protein